MTRLSVFVDEAGDFGADSDYYVVAIVLHDQSNSITDKLNLLDHRLADISGGRDPLRAIHTGPAIRGENDYRGLPVEVRKREFSRLFAFARRLPVHFQTFAFRKGAYRDRLSLKGAISRELSLFLTDNLPRFYAVDEVVVYYDNGQVEITDVLNTTCNALLFTWDFRRVAPVDYRLFQVADLHCTLEYLRLKVEDGRLSRSDLYFFGSARRLRKDFLNKLEHQRLGHRIAKP